MPAEENASAWTCRGCGRDHRPAVLDPGEAARCGRCGETLRVRPRTGPQMGVVWNLTGLGLFLAAGLLPILSVEKGGVGNDASLLVVAGGLAGNGMPLLALLAAWTVVWLPLLALGVLLMLNLAAWDGWSIPGAGWALRILRFARLWAMPEVFLLSVLVAFLKIGDLAHVSPGLGLWFFIAGTFALIMALQRVERDDLRGRLGIPVHPHPGSPQASLALMSAALILLLPANLLPIMEVRLTGQVQASTIVGGVRSLFEHGFWGIALIVFSASILVPFAKIGGLGWLLWTSRAGRGTRASMRLFRVIDFIGRWSMLDIFLVGLLAGLIRFGQIAEVRVGPAAPAFAAAVILTVLAVEQFDKRRLWPSPPVPLSLESHD